MRFTFWYISLPSSAKQREMTTFYVFSRKWAHDNFFFLFSYFDVVHSNLVPGQSSGEQSLRLSFSFLRRRKGGSVWMASALWRGRSPNVWSSQSCFVSSNWFSRASSRLVVKPMVIIEPVVQWNTELAARSNRRQALSQGRVELLLLKWHWIFQLRVLSLKNVISG